MGKSIVSHQSICICRGPLTSISLSLSLNSGAKSFSSDSITPERLDLHSLSLTFRGPHPMLIPTTILSFSPMPNWPTNFTSSTKRLKSLRRSLR